MSNVKGCSFTVKNEFNETVIILARHFYDGNLNESTGPIKLGTGQSSSQTPMTTGTNDTDKWSVVVCKDGGQEIYSMEQITDDIKNDNTQVLITVSEEALSITPGFSQHWSADFNKPYSS